MNLALNQTQEPRLEEVQDILQELKVCHRQRIEVATRIRRDCAELIRLNRHDKRLQRRLGIHNPRLFHHRLANRAGTLIRGVVLGLMFALSAFGQTMATKIASAQLGANEAKAQAAGAFATPAQLFPINLEWTSPTNDTFLSGYRLDYSTSTNGPVNSILLGKVTQATVPIERTTNYFALYSIGQGYVSTCASRLRVAPVEKATFHLEGAATLDGPRTDLGPTGETTFTNALAFFWTRIEKTNTWGAL